MRFDFIVSCLTVVVAIGPEWQLCPSSPISQEPKCVKTRITRSVHEALFEAKVIPDPMMGFNDDVLKDIANTDWSFSTTITDGPVTALHFPYIGGYGSNIYMDDELVKGPIVNGSFVPVSIETVGTGTTFRLRIELKSAVNVAQAIGSRLDFPQVPKCPPEAQHGFCGVEYIRVPQYGFGWDWGPGFGSVGFLMSSPSAANDRNKIFITTVLTDDKRSWNVGVQIDGIGGLTVANIVITNSTFSWSINDVPVITSTDSKSSLSFQIDRKIVCSWFPDDPCLYTIKICPKDSTFCFEKPEIGFRQIEIRESALVFNHDRPVFIRGTNLIPTNAYSAPPSVAEIDLVFAEILASGLNLVRIWGGGFYGSDYLYSLANRHGVMLWEELKFACASYPFEDKEFAEIVEGEIQYQFRRIHSNPSLVIVSGDNEVRQMLDGNWFGASGDQLERLRGNYAVMQKKIGEIVESVWPKEGGQIVFVPTSPNAGFDTHFYDYYGDCRDVSKYGETEGIISEYGFQSFCDWDSCLSKMVAPESHETVRKELAKTSKFLLHRQHRTSGMSELENEITLLMSDAKSPTVESFVWYSLISQSVCLKASTESFRRNPKIEGVMYWQFNDVWPGASWSTIDYYNQRKPSWYYTKSSFAKSLVSLFVDENHHLIVSVIGTVAAENLPTQLLLVNILSGKYQVFSLPASTEGVELFRKPLASVCPSNNCVAAVSKTNYIMIGSPDRSRHEFRKEDVDNPLSVVKTGGGTTILNAHIPTPFIFIQTDGNLETNFFFLAPVDGWNSVEIAASGEIESIKTYWSFLGDNSQHSIKPHVVEE